VARVQVALAVRIIPVILMDGKRQVKGEKFVQWRTVGSVEQAVRINQSREVDELILIETNRSRDRAHVDLGLLKELTSGCFMPVTVGGGITSMADVEQVLRAGADKVCITTALDYVPNLARDISRSMGCQVLVGGLDIRNDTYHIMSGTARGGYHRGAVEQAQWLEDSGCGEILLTSIDREGTLEGYDLDLIQRTGEAVSVPVIANGGCSGPEDMRQAICNGASAVAAGALFQYTDWTPNDCAEHLNSRGIESRTQQETIRESNGRRINAR
jgi:imidazole glycerol-phosphate synthase subunit HisF